MRRRWTENTDPKPRIRLVKVTSALWLVCPTRWSVDEGRRVYIPADEVNGGLASSFAEALKIQSDMLAGRWKW